ncbi:hypothetical protein [Sedimentitalea todarodis]|uniref:Uncharacterized protein n=1 Tax=Sedimentitalea todarodis TaxID=1631240 RepID=A0ABU3VFG0_9RHOB|nr:hypothetical protein [Sedimentitalea todarodis]MDU9004917.1 hypothetical protein [Sedimentitalea todarodis]
MKPLRVFLSLCAAALLATATAAQPVDWANINGWDVAYYPGSKGCQAFALFDEETAFFIGYDGKGEKPALDVTVLNTSWDMIEHGEEYPVRLRFGDQAAWTLNMDGVVLNGFPGLHILIDAGTSSAQQFTREFKRERIMAWRRADQTLGRFPLTGSNNAFKAVHNCHAFHREARAVRAKTSRVRSPKTDDPFAN